MFEDYKSVGTWNRPLLRAISAKMSRISSTFPARYPKSVPVIFSVKPTTDAP